MSNKVTYIFVAEDKFTKVAARIAKAAKAIDNAVKGINPNLKTINIKVQRPTRQIQSISKQLNELKKKIGETDKSTKQFSSNFKKRIEKVAHASEKFTKLADQFGMMAYFQLMNIEFPMAILVKLGNDYAEAMDNARDSISTIFDKTKGYMAFQKNITDMATQFGATTRFSAAQVMSVASLIANMTNNMQSVQIAVPAILKYTLGTGQAANLQGAARQFMSGVLSGRLPRANIILTGGSPFQRFKQAIDEINKKYGGMLGKDAESSSAQFQMMTNDLKELSAIVFQALEPAFAKFHKTLSSMVRPLSEFIKTHKTLVAVLGKAAIFTTTFLVILVGLGAVLGALVLPLHLLKFAIIGFSAVLEMTPIGWIISGILALISLLGVLALNFDKVKNSAEAAWGWIGKTAHWGMDKLIGGGEFIHEHLHQLAPTDQNVHMWLHIKDKGENVSGVHTQSSQSVKTHVNLGTNMGTP